MAAPSKARMKRLAEIEKQIISVQDVNHLLHMLLWGQTKSGKTAFIASAPKPLIFAVEEGTMTVRGKKGVQVFPFTQGGDYRTPKWKDAIDFIYYIRYGDHDRETAAVDTMTALARVAMRFINKDEEARDEARAPGTTDRRTYGRLATAMSDFMEDLEAACLERGMHLIYTCQERRLNEEQAAAEGADYVPDLTPAVRSVILEKPSIVARTFKEEVETDDLEADPEVRYGMYFRHPEWPVGERLTPIGASKPWLPTVSYKATVPALLRRIEKAKKEA